MSGFDQLEHELAIAERRLGGPLAVNQERRLGWRRLAAGAAPVMAVIVALVIGAGGILLLDHRAESDHAGHPAAPAVERLVAKLGVLRSPQTAAARRWLHGTDFRRLNHAPRRLGVIPSLVRALTLPDRERLILYVAQGSGSGSTGLGYMERRGVSGEGGCCTTAGELSRPAGPGPLYSQSGRMPPQVYFEIVPDGVSKVRWTFARNGNFGYTRREREQVERHTGHPFRPGSIGAPNSAPLTVTVPVHSNVAAMKLPDRGAAVADTWLNALGQVVAHHGR